LNLTTQRQRTNLYVEKKYDNPHDDLYLIYNGASAPNPDKLFALMQKVSKKIKTAPASLEKLALSWLKPPKLAPSSLKQGCFKRQLHLFSGSPDEVVRLRDFVHTAGRFADNYKKKGVQKNLDTLFKFCRYISAAKRQSSTCRRPG
jgi:hypothetical protein